MQQDPKRVDIGAPVCPGPFIYDFRGGILESNVIQSCCRSRSALSVVRKPKVSHSWLEV